MKNFQKLGLALVVAVMATGFSAFKHANDSNISNNKNVSEGYYRLPEFASTSSDDDPSHYIYSTSGNCSTSSYICSSEWKTDFSPQIGDSPADLGNPVRLSDGGSGTYDGN